MTSMRRGGWFAGILAAALLPASCSGPGSVAERVERGLPTALELALPDSVTGRPITLTLSHPERAATLVLTLDRTTSAPLNARSLPGKGPGGIWH